MPLEQLAVVRRWAGNSEQWLTDFLERAPGIPSIVSIVVIGSAVRERGHRRSDLDLLIIYRGKRPTLHAPLEVDIRHQPVEHAEERVRSGHEVLCWALKFGTAVYDPHGWWNELNRSWRVRLPMPSAIDARTRGEQNLEKAREMLVAGDESAADDLVLAAATQFARQRLIENGVFPASRPELPQQLRNLFVKDSLATVLDDAMFGGLTPEDLIGALAELGF